MFSKYHTISQLTSTTTKLSDRANRLINKDINKLELNELAFLIREQIGSSICIPFATNKLMEQEIKISMLHRSKQSESQRELIRELVLLDNWYWDINSKENKQLKELLGVKIDYLNLQNDIKQKFKDYTPKKLIWNEKSIQNFNAYMNDSRVGVICGYQTVTSLKRAILNGNSIHYQMNGESININTVKEFEESIVNNLDCNDELIELLRKEKKINHLE